MITGVATVPRVLRGLVIVGAFATWSGATPATREAAAVKVAVFPLAGDAGADVREKVGFALRQKLGRAGAFDVVPGVDVQELLADDAHVGADAPPARVRAVARELDAAVLVWGTLTAGNKPASLAGATLRLKVLDARAAGDAPREVTRRIDGPEDLRFATEELLAAVPGYRAPPRPNEQAVKDDETSRRQWATNPNLVANGGFSAAGRWDALYMAERYPVAVEAALPAADKVNVYRMPAAAAGAAPGEAPDNVLAMRLSRTAAEGNGLACLSDPVRIKSDARYRLSFRYQSDGPVTRVFVKGYTTGKALDGRPAEREVFRTQVNPTGPTNGRWETVVCDVNPFHPAFPVETLRVDLYAYLSPGVILWDDVVLKEVGPLQDRPADAAIERPVVPTTRPARDR